MLRGLWRLLLVHIPQWYRVPHGTQAVIKEVGSKMGTALEGRQPAIATISSMETVKRQYGYWMHGLKRLI